ncbi:MAG: alpha/beta hydrolase [Deltaproteobacteria bacterium]|nr:alpha/beta hydrolase [Deltaproteobacteria bacterium]
MNAEPANDYHVLDRPEVSMLLFHPRAENPLSPNESPGIDVPIPVEPDVSIGARFHISGETAANILFFHGNGEIVADYDELGPVYNRLGINFMPVDYRGYGRSDGTPTVSAMMRDCHAIFAFVKNWLKEKGYCGPLIVMGRSLGSASALELAGRYAHEIDALIIESGFALAAPLLALLGIDARRLGFREENGFGNIDKIGRFDKPTLIIHAEYDHIIPFSDGEALYESAAAKNKKLLQIPGANHNDIFARGLSAYLAAVGNLVKSLPA